LLAGFTTVRDVGSGEGVGFALKQAINAGAVAGPRMFVSGPSLAITGGHGDPTNGAREDLLGMPTEEQGVVDGVDSATKGARLAIKRGADLIKITATGGVLSIARDGSAAQFYEDEIAAIVRVAEGFGLKVTAHAHGDEGMQRAIRAGVKSIEHGTYMSDETMQLMIDNEVYFVPTITAGRSVADSARIEGYYVPVVAQKALEIGPVIQGTFGKAYQAGVPIAFGTDAGVFKHGRNAKEFEYMVEAGMPAMEALRSATYNAADLLDQLDQLGTLEPGKLADVVAVPRNPLDDITAMHDVSFVMKEGKVYKREGRETLPMTSAR
jgi:imidazolonepropionase-like amidohydrolase